MSDKYQKLVPGDRWVPNAELHNETIDVVNAYRAQKATQGAIGVGSRPLRILNSTASTLRRFAVVGIGTSITGTEVDADEYRETLGFNSSAPAAADPFAILQEDAFPGTIEDAVATGETNAYVSFSSTSHTYAAPAAADYDKLASQSSAGPARILSNEIPANTQLNGGINDVVTTIVVDTADGWPDPADVGAFVILVESEKMNVTAISGTTWTVTRAYSGTTGAVHADNTAVAFFSGVVLARVQLFGTDLGEFIPTIITSPATGTATGQPDFIFKTTTNASVNPSFSAGNDTVELIGLLDTTNQVISGEKTFDDDLYFAKGNGSYNDYVFIHCELGLGLTAPYLLLNLDTDFGSQLTPTEWKFTYVGGLIAFGDDSRFGVCRDGSTLFMGADGTDGIGNVIKGGLVTTIATSITSVGTITTGVWNGTDIAVADGGTGRSSHTAYAVICGGTTSTAAQQSVASVGTAGQVLTSNGAGALPSFQAVSAGVPTTITVADTTDTTCFIAIFEDATGDLGPKTDGGLRYNAATSNLAIGAAGASTGIISFVGTTSGTVQFKVADAAGTWALTLPTSDGDAGQFLQTDGTGVTTWASAAVPTSITVADTTDTSCWVMLAEDATGDISPKTDGQLRYNATNASLSIGVAGGVTGKIEMRGTTSGVITIQSAAAAGTYTLTLPTDDGTAGQYLQTDGSGVLSWATATATNATTVTVADTTDTTCWVALFESATGDLAPKTDAGILYDASTATLGIGAASASTGKIALKGTTSGTVTVSVADAAGTWTLKLPTDDGTSGQFLQTDGSGVTSWTSATTATSGEYSPTYTLTTNLTSVAGTSSTHLLYTRVGDCVIVFGKFAPQPTAAGTCELGISLPIASNFGNAYEAVGYALGQTTLTNCEVTADTTNDRLYMIWTSDGSSEDWFVWVKYKVI